MTRMPLLISCLLALLAGMPASGQTPVVDSLKAAVRAAPDDRARLTALLALCDRRESLHADTMEIAAYRAQALARKLGLRRELQLATFHVASCLTKKRQMEEAMRLVEEQLPHLSYAGAQADLYVRFKKQQGQILLMSGRYKEALAVFYALLSEAEARQDRLTVLHARTNISWTYMEMERYAEAIGWLRGTIALGPANAEQERYMGVVYSNLASCYSNVGQLDSAGYFIDKAIAHARANSYLMYLANGLAIRADILVHKRQYKAAEASLAEAVAIRRKLDDAYYLVSDLAQLADFYASTGAPAKGTRVANDAIAIALKAGITAKLPLLYGSLAANYQAAGDYRNYGQTLERLLAVKDSLYGASSAQAIAELRAKYELQAKETTIIRQQLAISRKNGLLYGGIGLFLAAGSTVYFLFRNYRRQQVLRVRQLLEEEKRLSAAAIAEAAEKERARISADLHDNLGAYAASIASNMDHLRLPEGDAANARTLEALRENALAMVAELSDTIWVMKKDALLLTAISDRLKAYIHRLQVSHPETRIDVEEEIVTDHLLTPVQAFHLFKILQEAITNALRHSGGNRIVIRMDAAESWLIRISDNGRGMKETAARHSGGNGLQSMQARSREAGWVMAMVANESAGLTVRIQPVVQFANGFYCG